MLRNFSISLCLLACVAACSSTTTRPPDPPNLRPLLQPEKIEGKYKSIELLKADPTSTVEDLFNFGHDAEAALRRANRDQIDANALLDRERAPVVCGFWRKIRGQCTPGNPQHEREEAR